MTVGIRLGRMTRQQYDDAIADHREAARCLEVERDKQESVGKRFQDRQPKPQGA